MEASQGFVIIAHRGHQGLAPESTMEAFDAAIQAGWAHIEMDVQLTSDGVPIILHDEFLGRTVTGSGRVADTTWAQLQDQEVGSWYTREAPDWTGRAGRTSPDWSHCRIPTLDQVLSKYLGQAHIHLELKSKQEQLPQAVAASLTSNGWVDGSGQLSGPLQGHTSDEWSAVPGITITSFHIQQLEASVKLLPGVRHAWLVHGITDEVLQTAAAAKISQLCPLAELLTPSAVSQAKARGFSVRAWGLKDTKNLLAAKRCGAQGGTCDDPTQATEFFIAHKQE